MLPISVLIPTLNCGALVPAHLQSLRAWLDLAQEVVVVDSHSKDNTVELIRQGLAHPRISFLSHPPGLYQSWNFGIQQARSKYLYIATVGDSISRHGLKHLFDVAEKLRSDVVISKPAFINEAGEPLPDDHWPIDEILANLKVARPQLLTTSQQFLFAVTNTWGALLGSSASNLYLTDCLKQRPFPTEFGTAGDGGWGIQNIFEVKIAVTPERFSSFRKHAKAYSLSQYHVESLASKLFDLAQTVIARQQGTNPAVQRTLRDIRWPELEKLLDTERLQQTKLIEYRGQTLPWFLKPAAWKARSVRNRAKKDIIEITRPVLAGHALEHKY